MRVCTLAATLGRERDVGLPHIYRTCLWVTCEATAAVLGVVFHCGFVGTLLRVIRYVACDMHRTAVVRCAGYGLFWLDSGLTLRSYLDMVWKVHRCGDLSLHCVHFG